MSKQTTATETYVVLMVQIQKRLEALQDKLDNHFGVDPDAVKYAHCGDAGKILELLDQANAVGK